MKQKDRSTSNTKKLMLSALFAAITCVATIIIKIPSPKGYVNLGDAIVLLAGWTLSPMYGFIAAATGSMIADLLLGYTAYAPATFVIKGTMALVGFLFEKKVFSGRKSSIGRIVGGVCAETVMVLGYYVFEGFLYGGEGGFMTAILSVPFNVFQGAVGLIAGLVLAKIFEKAKIISI